MRVTYAETSWTVVCLLASFRIKSQWDPSLFVCCSVYLENLSSPMYLEARGGKDSCELKK